MPDADVTVVPFLDRDHSIQAFNERVLDWTQRASVPLLTADVDHVFVPPRRPEQACSNEAYKAVRPTTSRWAPAMCVPKASARRYSPAACSVHAKPISMSAACRISAARSNRASAAGCGAAGKCASAVREQPRAFRQPLGRHGPGLRLHQLLQSRL